MIRPFHTWLLFGLCLTLATAAMGWVSWKALELEAAAAHEADVRLALWRIDSALAPLIAQESARPYFMYQPFYPAERAYTRMYAELQPDEILLPSPLLTFASTDVLVHFQVGPDGKFTSPQVPEGSMLDLAETGYVSAERVRAAAGRLGELRTRLRQDVLVAALPAPQGLPVQQLAQNDGFVRGMINRLAPGMVNATPQQSTVNQGDTQNSPNPPAQVAMADAQSQEMVQQVPPPGPQQARPQGKIQSQELSKSTREYNKRSDNSQFAQQMASSNLSFNRGPVFNKSGGSPVNEGILKAVWAGDALVLARRVSADGREYIQGCLLNWPEIRRARLADIADLLPNAELEAVEAESALAADRQTQMLATVPARLVPGPALVPPITVVSPIRISLLITWACVLVAAGAIGMLLLGAMSLSERRGAFVSAVTHELRTPLTTLRMYTEMLAEGMVRDEEKRQSYLQAMEAEADRLGHLVENVLAYSRIERGRARGQVVTLPVGELIAGVRRRLSERAEHAGMKLVVGESVAEPVAVRADPSVVEQILFNLVDNACKYAASASDRTIQLAAGRENGMAVIRVCDAGPGISAADQRRLFRPFSKSASQAANSAPGVGLGLALSRRLAREMGGDLRLENGRGPGACFVLTLPTSAG